MKKGMSAIISLMLFSSFLFGCSGSNPTDVSSKAVSKSETTTVKLGSSSVTEATNDEITVNANIQNVTDKALPIQPSELVLIVASTSTVLSPSTKSQIPSQVPAGSNVKVSLVFDNGGKIKNGDDAMLGFQPDANQPEQFVALGKITQKNPTTSTGAINGQSTVTFVRSNGTKVQLPVEWIKAEYGVTRDQTPSVESPTPLPDVSFDLPEDVAKQLSAYWVNRGDGNGFLFLGPKDWIPAEAGFGANGSYSIILQPQTDPNEKLFYMSDGACRGCSIGDIGTYFPDLRKWASDQGFPADNLVITVGKNFDPNTVAYQVDSKVKGYQTVGVAHGKVTSEGVSFGRVEMTVPYSESDAKWGVQILLYYAKMIGNS